MDEGVTPPRHPVFICYRRKDTGAQAKTFRENLDLRLGPDTAFLDTRSVKAGDEWPEELRRALLASRVVVVFIGPRWLSIKNEHHQRRIDDEKDWVRLEIQAALENGKQIVPLLVRGAKPIVADALPTPMKGLATKQAERFETGDTQRHVDRIQDLLKLRVDTLGLYRQHLRACHQKLVSFAPDAGDALLAEVYVEIDVDPLDDPRERTRTRPNDPDKLAASGVTTLRSLLEQPRSDDYPGRYVLQGEPGAGKSTLTRYLTSQLAREDDPATPLPVFIPLAKWSTTDGHALDLADPGASSQSHRDALKARIEALAGADGQPGAVWVLLDGLDEVAPDRLSQLRERLYVLVADLPNAHFVVTTRQIGYRSLGDEWLHVRLRPLDTKKQRDLLGKWLDPAKADDLHASLQVHPEISKLAGNPLLLTLLADLARRSKSFAPPTTRTQLYGETIHHLLNKDYNPEDGTQPIDHPTDAKRLLVHLAHALQNDAAVAWSHDHLVETLDDLAVSDKKLARSLDRYTDTGDFLKQVAERTGILAPHDGHDTDWKFLHRQFREFLAATHLAADRTRFLAFVEQLPAEDLPRWSETIGMACGLIPDSLDVVRALAKSSPAAAVRSLGEIEGASASALLDVLDSIPTKPLTREPAWDGDDLRAAVQSWERRGLATKDDLRSSLLRRVQPVTDRATRIRAAWIHHALSALGKVDRNAFFAAAKVAITASLALDLLPIRGGSFTQGSPDTEAGRLEWEGPERPVTVPSFELSKYAVTNIQYRLFAPEHEVELFGKLDAADAMAHPVVNVSWWEVYLYCAWAGCRLPTESEWEYACRAGSTGPFSFDGPLTTNLVNYRGEWDFGDGTSSGEFRERTVKAGELPGNAWGLHEMHGNVWEWCEDRWHESYEGAPVDGRVWQDGGERQRVVRGGSCSNSGGFCRSAFRFRDAPGNAIRFVGFRPARSSH